MSQIDDKGGTPLDRMESAVNMVAPDHTSILLKPVASPILLDTLRRSSFRFARGVFSRVSAWFPDVWTRLSTPVDVSDVELNVTYIPRWFRVGDLISLGQKSIRRIDRLSLEDLRLTLNQRVGFSIDTLTDLYLFGSRMVQIEDSNGPDVILESEYPLLVGDSIFRTTSNSLDSYELFSVKAVVSVSESRYAVTLNRSPKSKNEDIWYLRAHPAVISDKIVVDDILSEIGIALLDIQAQALVDTVRVEEKINLSVLNRDEEPIQSSSLFRRNTVVLGQPVLASSFLFGHVKQGEIQYDVVNESLVLMPDSSNYTLLRLDLIGTWTTGNRWRVQVKAPASGSLRVKFSGGAWQHFDVSNGNVNINQDVSAPDHVLVCWHDLSYETRQASKTALIDLGFSLWAPDLETEDVSVPDRTVRLRPHDTYWLSVLTASADNTKAALVDAGFVVSENTSDYGLNHSTVIRRLNDISGLLTVFEVPAYVFDRAALRMGSWTPVVAAQYIQYTHLAAVNSPLWSSTGLMLKPAFHNLGELITDRLNSGGITQEKIRWIGLSQTQGFQSQQTDSILIKE